MASRKILHLITCNGPQSKHKHTRILYYITFRLYVLDMHETNEYWFQTRIAFQSLLSYACKYSKFWEKIDIQNTSCLKQFRKGILNPSNLTFLGAALFSVGLEELTAGEDWCFVWHPYTCSWVPPHRIQYQKMGDKSSILGLSLPRCEINSTVAESIKVFLCTKSFKHSVFLPSATME